MMALVIFVLAYSTAYAETLTIAAVSGGSSSSSSSSRRRSSSSSSSSSSTGDGSCDGLEFLFLMAVLFFVLAYSTAYAETLTIAAVSGGSSSSSSSSTGDRSCSGLEFLFLMAFFLYSHTQQHMLGH
jgi:uncharacterized low-complexity protein